MEQNKPLTAEENRRYFRKEDIEFTLVLSKWAEAHGISFSSLEASVINSAGIEYATLKTQ